MTEQDPVVVTMPLPEGSNAVIEAESDNPHDLIPRDTLRKVMIRLLLLPDEIRPRRKH